MFRIRDIQVYNPRKQAASGGPAAAARGTGSRRRSTSYTCSTKCVQKIQPHLVPSETEPLPWTTQMMLPSMLIFLFTPNSSLTNCCETDSTSLWPIRPPSPCFYGPFGVLVASGMEVGLMSKLFLSSLSPSFFSISSSSHGTAYQHRRSLTPSSSTTTTPTRRRIFKKRSISQASTGITSRLSAATGQTRC